MLRVNNLSAFYDRTQVLHEINLRVEGGRLSGSLAPTAQAKPRHY
jgi:ABC-type branched-subunit amino acid transport system ATPase component